MIEDRLHKLKAYKSIQLTEEERNALRAHGAHIVATVSPKMTESLLYRGVQHGLRIALSTFLFIVFIGSSVSVVADSALPGDPLYTFKVNVNEEVKGLFLETPEEKVVWQKNRIENRVNEIKTLAETKTLTKAKQETVNKALDSHMKALSKELTTLSDEAPSTALTMTASLETALLEDKKAIENNAADPENADALKAVDGTLKIVSEQEVKIISKEIDNIADAVMTVSTTPITGLDGKVETDTNVKAKTPTEKVTPIEP